MPVRPNSDNTWSMGAANNTLATGTGCPSSGLIRQRLCSTSTPITGPGTPPSGSVVTGLPEYPW